MTQPTTNAQDWTGEIQETDIIGNVQEKVSGAISSFTKLVDNQRVYNTKQATLLSLEIDSKKETTTAHVKLESTTGHIRVEELPVSFTYEELPALKQALKKQQLEKGIDVSDKSMRNQFSIESREDSGTKNQLDTNAIEGRIELNLPLNIKGADVNDLKDSGVSGEVSTANTYEQLPPNLEFCID